MRGASRDEVVEHLAAPPVTPGKKDLVLLPSHLCLTIHESIGHSTELDRALGYEANYAGTSFLTTEKMGTFRVGSELVNIFGDRTTEFGLSTVKYDDDGVKTVTLPDHRKRHLQALPDHPRSGPPDRRNRIARLLLCRFLGAASRSSACPTSGSRLVRSRYHPRRSDLGRRRRRPDRRRRQLLHRSAALQLPVRRRRVLGNQGRQEARHDLARRLPDRARRISGSPATPSRAAPTGSSTACSTTAKANPTQINAMSHGCAPARFRQINVLATD